MLVFRKASSADRRPVFEMYMDEKSNSYLTFDPMPEDAFEPLYESLLASGSLFVGTDADEIVATFRLIGKSHRQSHVLYLGSFVTRSSLQGKGIGSQSLKYIKEFALANGFRRIELTVDLHNEPAIHLYKKAGFEIEGIVRKSYRLASTGRFYDEYLMSLLPD